MKTKLLKLISIIAIFAVTVSIAMPVYALLGIRTTTVELETLQGGSYTLPEVTETYYKQSGLVSTYDDVDVETVIYEGLKNHDSSINVYSYKIPTSNISAVYTNVINNHPDLFYVSSSLQYSYTSQNVTYTLNPFYVMSADEIEAAKMIFDEGVSKALSGVDSSMTDLQKALVLHDYLCDIATYPNLSLGDQDIYHSAYGVFYDGNCVCAGYSLAYSYLLKRVGIESRYVVSQAMTHAWNLVKIGGNWYNVDLTFDDAEVFNKNSNTRGYVPHHCFLKSDAAFESELCYYHYDGKTNDVAIASSDEFDDAFWNNIDTNILVINGCYYYLSTGSTQYLYKRDNYGNEQKLGSSSFSSAASTLSGAYPDKDGVYHTVTSKDYYNRLVYLDGRFYINSNKAVYSYALVNGLYRKYTIISGFENYIIGLGKKDGQIVYQCRTEGPIPNAISKEQYFNSYLTKEKGVNYNNYVDINLDGVINGKDYLYIMSK